MKNWKIAYKVQSSKSKTQSLNADKIIKILLKNRGINTKNEIDKFLNPKLDDITIEATGLDKKKFAKSSKKN